MNDETSDQESDSQPPVDPDVSERFRLVGRLVVDEDGSAEYTVWPEEAPADELTAAWITARDEAFVALDAMR